jgi:prepilin-type N-terminal cleavage/methylation domain-containing protein
MNRIANEFGKGDGFSLTELMVVLVIIGVLV